VGGVEAPAVKELAALMELSHLDGVVGVLGRAAASRGVHHAFVHKAQLYLGLETCACDALRWIESSSGLAGPARLAAGLSLLRGVLLSLADTHARGWAHRDVKPGNVLLRRSGGPRGASGAGGCCGVALADAGLMMRWERGPCSGAPPAPRWPRGSDGERSKLWLGGPVAAEPAMRAPGRAGGGNGSPSSPPAWGTAPGGAVSPVPGLAAGPDSPAAPRRHCAQAGTLWYRAPELLFGAPRHGPAADVWSAACTGWELLCGRGASPVPLLRGDSEMQQIRSVADLLGPATRETWPGLALAAPYMVAPRTGGEDGEESGGGESGGELDARMRAHAKGVAAALGAKLRDAEALRGCDAGSLDAAAWLLSRMLVYDPDRRPTAAECAADACFGAACRVSEVSVPALRVKARRRRRGGRPGPDAGLLSDFAGSSRPPVAAFPSLASPAEAVSGPASALGSTGRMLFASGGGASAASSGVRAGPLGWGASPGAGGFASPLMQPSALAFDSPVPIAPPSVRAESGRTNRSVRKRPRPRTGMDAEDEHFDDDA